MKPLLAKLAPRRAVGVAIGDRAVTISLMAFTPLGPSELDRRAEPIGDGTPEAALRRALKPLVAVKPWRNAPVAVGLSHLHVFFSTRPIKRMAEEVAGGRKGPGVSPQMLLHEVLQSPNVIIDDMEVDMIRARPNRQPVASIVACRKKFLAPILEVLDECGVRPTRIEPSPCGLLRAAVARHRAPRRARTVLRVFLGDDEAMCVLTAGGLPLMWRGFALGRGSEAGEILSEFRATDNLCRYFGIESSIDAVMVHGRPDLSGLEASPEWAKLPGTSVRLDGPAYDGGVIASGLALGCQNYEARSFNLTRASAPPIPILNLVPWGNLALQVGLLTGVSLLLADELQSLERARTAVRAELSGFDRPRGRGNAQLREDRKAMTQRVEAVGRFLDGRILWTDCVRDVATRLPETMVTTSIAGECKYEAMAMVKGKAKRSFRVELETPTPSDGAIPPEVGRFLDELRGAPRLRKSLPSIEMAELRWGPVGQARVPTASFSVVCTPEAAKLKGEKKPSPH